MSCCAFAIPCYHCSGWMLGASCPQMVGSNSGKFANKGLSPLQPAGSSINLLAALLFTSQESSSRQNMYSILAVQSRKTFFSDETQFYLIGALQDLQKPPPWFLTINISDCSIWHTHSGEKEENISRLKFHRFSAAWGDMLSFSGYFFPWFILAL